MYSLILVLQSSCFSVTAFQKSIYSKPSSSLYAMGEPDTVASPGLLLVSLREKLGGVGDDDGEIFPRLVLASQSPRRREILDMMGLSGKYTTTVPPLDESFWQKELRKQNLHPTEYTRKLAEAKAQSAAVAQAGSVKGGTVFYLGSDTVVDIDDRILEKPVDTKEAKAMITRLSGRKVIFLYPSLLD